MDLQPCCNSPAMLIVLHSDSAYVHARRRQVLMSERILRLDDAARLF